MNEHVVGRGWRTASFAFIVVIVVLGVLLFQSCSALVNNRDAPLTGSPTGSPSGGPTSTPTSPTPTPEPTGEAGSGDGIGGDDDGRGGGDGSGNGGSGDGRATGGRPVPFGVSGNAPSGFEPGEVSSINLTFTNYNSYAITVRSVTATLGSVTAPQATGSLPCTVADFGIDQLDAGVRVTVPAHSSRTLSQAGIATADWPQFRMHNTTLNQDGCKGSTIAIHYSASGVAG